MKKEKLEYLAHLFIVLLGAALFAVLFLKYVVAAILPFVLAWLAVMAAERPAAYLSLKVKIPKRILRIILSVAVSVVSTLLLVVLSRLILTELWSSLSGLGEESELSVIVRDLSDQVVGIFGRFSIPDEIRQSLSEALSSMIGKMLSGIGVIFTSIASAIPGILLFVAVTAIAVLYFAWDIEGIGDAVSEILPSGVKKIASAAKRGVLTIAGKYIRSYAILLLITFTEMLFGLILLRVRYAFLFALILSLLDLLPVVGVGTALVPASVFCFLSGRGGLGVGLILIFLISAVVRQLAEPKILGKNLGVHPLATLASMYIGYSFFGFAGILLLPIFVIALGIYKNNSSEVAEGPIG